MQGNAIVYQLIVPADRVIWKQEGECEVAPQSLNVLHIHRAFSASTPLHDPDEQCISSYPHRSDSEPSIQCIPLCLSECWYGVVWMLQLSNTCLTSLKANNACPPMMQGRKASVLTFLQMFRRFLLTGQTLAQNERD